MAFINEHISKEDKKRYARGGEVMMLLKDRSYLINKIRRYLTQKRHVNHIYAFDEMCAHYYEKENMELNLENLLDEKINNEQYLEICEIFSLQKYLSLNELAALLYKKLQTYIHKGIAFQKPNYTVAL